MLSVGHRGECFSFNLSHNAPVVQLIFLMHFLNISVSQLEIENGEELTSDFLYEEVHPKQHAHKQRFAKPKGPAGKKGGRRITRPPGEREEED